MRKMVAMALVAAAVVAMTSASAMAFTFEVGNNKAKMADFGSMYDPSTLLPRAMAPVNALPASVVSNFQVGDLDVTVFKITGIAQPQDNQTDYYSANSSNTELLGIVSDVKISAISAPFQPFGPGTDVYVTIDLVSAGRFAVAGSGYTGGRVDIWQDTPKDFSPAGNGGYPNDFGFANTSGFAAGWDAYPFDAGEYDTFPTVTDGTATPLLSGTLISPNNNGVLLTITLDLTNFSGYTTLGYIHLLDNYSGSIFDPAFLNGQAEIEFKNSFSYYADPGLSYDTNGSYDSPGGPVRWDTASDDPIRFTIIPEPTTIALLGTGLVSLLGYARRRSR